MDYIYRRYFKHLKLLNMRKLLLSAALIGTMISMKAQKSEPLTDKQISKIDFSGKWIGKRFQYNTDGKTIVQSFEYEFDLKQEGNIIVGTSTIISASGNFGDMKLRGVIIGNKLHFEEYAMASQNMEEGKVWCLKSGELSIAKADNTIKLEGATPSYMSDYYLPCSGGFTELVKVEEGSGAIDFSTVAPVTATSTDGFSIHVFPNPFMDKATISYHLEGESKVTLQVFDIEGKVVTELQNGKLNSGVYSVVIDAKDLKAASGILIAKLTIDGKVYSQQIVHANQ
jgi:hypothetical protein